MLKCSFWEINMTRPLELTGRAFDRLTVLNRGPNSKNGRSRWKCVCVCGKEFETTGTQLVTGNTKSCGCLKTELAKQNCTHGEARRGAKGQLYSTWLNMRQRCSNPKNVSYLDYGGKGIAICKEWDDFTKFRDDMGQRPPGYSLERLDGSKGYSKDNCV
jgi:hypothetical protein